MDKLEQAAATAAASERIAQEVGELFNGKDLIEIGAALALLSTRWIQQREIFGFKPADEYRSYIDVIRKLVWLDSPVDATPEAPVENVAATQDPGESEALNQVLDRAHELGLHGLVLLSPKCPDCGQLHGFAMVSDLNTDKSIAHLLAQFSGYASTMEAEVIYRPQDHKRKGKPS